jgi:mono/diheme cytochrome c family protein
MSDPRDDLSTDAAPESDAPGPGSEDSVQAMHKPHVDIMNDPVMVTVDGVDVERTAGPGGQDSVQALHDVFMREQAEPRDGFEPVPFWVAIVCGGLLMWGGYYVGSGSADFRRDVFDRSDLRPPPTRPADVKEPDPQTVPDLMKIGGQVYGSRCVSCHGPEGKGGQGVPPLAGSEWVAGAQAGPARQTRIVLYGIQGDITVNGGRFNGNMPSWSALRDYEIASVITYVRNSWGNKADPDDGKPAITAAAVAAARAKEGLKRAPLTEAELKAIPTDQSDAVAPAPKKEDKK